MLKEDTFWFKHNFCTRVCAAEMPSSVGLVPTWSKLSMYVSAENSTYALKENTNLALSHCFQVMTRWGNMGIGKTCGMKSKGRKKSEISAGWGRVARCVTGSACEKEDSSDKNTWMFRCPLQGPRWTTP